MERKIIFLMTPQHTGTHFCRMLLETHPSVSFCLTASLYKIPREFKIASRFLSGETDVHEWERLFDQKMIETGERLRKVSEDYFDEFGIRVEPKPEDGMRLYHDHIHNGYFHPNFKFGEGRLDQIKTVVTLRDPLLAVISALRRTVRGAEKATLILQGIRFASTMKGVFYFCTDLWRDRPEKALKVFEYLGLAPVPASSDFLRIYPMINHTAGGGIKSVWRRGWTTPVSAKQAALENTPEANDDLCPVLDAKTLGELRDARDLLIRRNRVHPILKKWEDVLRRHPEFEDFYRSLGYTGLVWFKNPPAKFFFFKSRTSQRLP